MPASGVRVSGSHSRSSRGCICSGGSSTLTRSMTHFAFHHHHVEQLVVSNEKFRPCTRITVDHWDFSFWTFSHDRFYFFHSVDSFLLTCSKWHNFSLIARNHSVNYLFECVPVGLICLEAKRAGVFAFDPKRHNTRRTNGGGWKSTRVDVRRRLEIRLYASGLAGRRMRELN